MRISDSGGEMMTRSEAARRYTNLIHYQLRPFLANTRLSEEEKVTQLKRLVRMVTRVRVESGSVAGGGPREEVLELIGPWLRPEAPHNEEVKDWVMRLMRAYGVTIDNGE